MSVEELEKRVQGMEIQIRELQEKIANFQPFPAGKMPPHIKEVLDALGLLGIGDAEMVGKAVGKERATCSAVLNYLERMGRVKGVRAGKRRLFKLSGGLL